MTAGADVRDLIAAGLPLGEVAMRMRITMVEVAWHLNPAEHAPEEWAVLFQNRGVPGERMTQLLGVFPAKSFRRLSPVDKAIALYLEGRHSKARIIKLTGLPSAYVFGLFNQKSKLYWNRHEATSN